MQFKHPELLYALLLLIIPIIVHLFQLRKFQKVPFTNVDFLKSVSIQTRKSSQLKKWLILTTRLLLLTLIIFAFAQPYFSKTKDISAKAETVIYLDNSFSMQAKGANGELLKRSVQNIIDALDTDLDITIFTNDQTFKNSNQGSLKEELLNLDYSSSQLDYNAVLLKGEKLFSSNKASLKNLVLLSDFQQKETSLKIDKNNNHAISLVQLSPVNRNNISIDSAYISKVGASNLELTVSINNQSNTEDVSVSLFNDNLLMAKSSINSTNELSTTFSLPNNSVINGKITIDDASLQFDNSLYFNLNKNDQIKVLAINSVSKSFLNRVFTDNEFNFKSTNLEQLNFNDIEQQNLIVLNEIETIPISLSNALNTFVNKGGYLLIIPSENISLQSYNQIVTINGLFKNLNPNIKKITTINYSHPILNDVFNKQVANFQYPIVNSFYPIKSSNNILQYEDGKPFLIQKGNVFLFTAALNPNNSNFTNSPLIVPTLYNIGRTSLQLPKLYYTIGKENSFDINTNLQQDDILKLSSKDQEIIPQQRTFNNKVTINTSNTPSFASIYKINNKTETLKRISYNYNRDESNLIYNDLSNLVNVSVSKSIPEVFTSIKNDANVNELWKWFTIFALFLLIIEMLILKYFK